MPELNGFVLTCLMTRTGERGICRRVSAVPLGLLGAGSPLIRLNRESMESNLTRVRLPGWQHTTHALSRKGRYLTFRASL